MTVLECLGAGMLLGLTAGVSPGPLLLLVIAETLKYRVKAGVKVALAPVITDVPIILLVLSILSSLSRLDTVLGIISLLGGGFVCYLGWDIMRVKVVRVVQGDGDAGSLRKGVLTNLLSPHPYLFWLSVGGPLLAKGWNTAPSAGLAFIGSFYVCLVGSKILLALAVGRWRGFLHGAVYPWILRCLGTLLLVFSALLFRDAFRLLAR